MDFSKISNMPPTGQLVTRSIVVVENRVGTGSSTFISQTLYEMFVSQIWYRTCKDGTWSSWTRCDNFGCSTPADLASLLGGSGVVSNIPANTDLNSFTTPGRHEIGGVTLRNAYTTEIIRGQIVVESNPTGCTQIIYTQYPNAEIHIRGQWNGVWTAWN